MKLVSNASHQVMNTAHFVTLKKTIQITLKLSFARVIKKKNDITDKNTKNRFNNAEISRKEKKRSGKFRFKNYDKRKTSRKCLDNHRDHSSSHRINTASR